MIKFHTRRLSRTTSSSAASPFRLRHKSIPESRSSIRRGFVRPNDKAHSGQPREKCGATSSCPTNRRNGGTRSSHKSLGPAANARSANGAGCSSGARSRERRTLLQKQLGQIRAVLSGDPRDERGLVITHDRELTMEPQVEKLRR